MWLGKTAGWESSESLDLAEAASEDTDGAFDNVLLPKGRRGLNTDPVGWKHPLTVSPGV